MLNNLATNSHCVPNLGVTKVMNRSSLPSLGDFRPVAIL